MEKVVNRKFLGISITTLITLNVNKMSNSIRVKIINLNKKKTSKSKCMLFVRNTKNIVYFYV